jgi:hypothetical protein
MKINKTEAMPQIMFAGQYLNRVICAIRWMELGLLLCKHRIVVY